MIEIRRFKSSVTGFSYIFVVENVVHPSGDLLIPGIRSTRSP